jgi:nitronate monooxygenase
MGTAFLTCDESGVPPAYKDAILHTPETQTRITRAFSGRPARGIINRFMTDLDKASILPFPLQTPSPGRCDRLRVSRTARNF